jgi:hypothetical protein
MRMLWGWLRKKTGGREERQEWEWEMDIGGEDKERNGKGREDMGWKKEGKKEGTEKGIEGYISV